MVILKRIGVIFLRFGISLIILIFLFGQVNPGSLLATIKKSDKLLIYLSFLVTFFGYFFCYLRWKMLLEAAGIRLPVKRLVSAFSGGIFFNTFLPSTIGGDFVRSADIGYHSRKTSTVVATVLLDRLSGFAGMTAVALIALLFGLGVVKDYRVISALILLSVLFFTSILVVFNNRIFSVLIKLFHSPHPGRIRSGMKSVLQQMHDFKLQKDILIKNLFLSMAIQTIAPVTTYMMALSFHLDVNIVYFFLFIPIITAVTLLPISIGGLGVRDYMTILLFTSMGISKNFAFAFSLLGFFFILIYAGIGGLIYVLTLHNRRL